MFDAADIHGDFQSDEADDESLLLDEDLTRAFVAGAEERRQQPASEDTVDGIHARVN